MSVSGILVGETLLLVGLFVLRLVSELICTKLKTFQVTVYYYVICIEQRLTGELGELLRGQRTLIDLKHHASSTRSQFLPSLMDSELHPQDHLP